MLVSVKLLAFYFLLVQGESTCYIFRNFKSVINSETEDTVGFYLPEFPEFSACAFRVLDKIIFCLQVISRVYIISSLCLIPKI